METHSRKRVGASSSAPSSFHPSKRSRSNPTNPPSVTTRSRCRSRSNLSSATAIVAAATNKNNMDPSPPAAPDSSSSRCHSSRDENKGKERKPPSPAPSSRSREVERLLGLTFNVVVPTDDGAGLLHHNLSSSSSALQGLLRTLGAGLDDLFPSSSGTPGAD